MIIRLFFELVNLRLNAKMKALFKTQESFDYFRFIDYKSVWKPRLRKEINALKA